MPMPRKRMDGVEADYACVGHTAHLRVRPLRADARLPLEVQSALEAARSLVTLVDVTPGLEEGVRLSSSFLAQALREAGF